ncbi:transposase (plasmid) [Bacillus cereus H3081.97]|uniref:Transposase n=1 Tax=Bacillus cereus (strain AH187) TaxID=405534 RepID=B7I1B7_BACC7|nr:transposase [Bacillus cereus H3081.97]ACJ82781.1 transposase [Bacillus cereus AH187]
MMFKSNFFTIHKKKALSLLYHYRKGWRFCMSISVSDELNLFA